MTYLRCKNTKLSRMVDMPYKELKKRDNTSHPVIQLLIFIALFIGVLLLGNLIGIGLVFAIYGLKTVMAFTAMDVTAPHFAPALWILQITGTTLPILIAPVIFTYKIVNDSNYIKPAFRFPWVLILLVFAIMFISNPLIEFLSNLNQKMVLPPFLHWMRDSEDQAQKLTETLLQMNTIWDMIIDVLLVGLLTAIVEEFMFRGVIQTIFYRWTKSVHAAVWITAILFSAFHMEFFGFLPRLLLGVLFGYFVAWSGSIWPAVWAHFLNNASAVVATYLFKHKLIKINPDDQHMFTAVGYLVSLFIVLFLLYIYYKTGTDKQQIAED
jgi:membrane protease YdiL (CAAX protease family)